MKYCGKCGYGCSDSSKYCVKCGNELVNDNAKEIGSGSIKVKSKKNYLWIVILIGVVLIGIAVAVLVIHKNKADESQEWQAKPEEVVRDPENRNVVLGVYESETQVKTEEKEESDIFEKEEVETNEFDAGGYVNAVLKNIYWNNAKDYMEIVDITAEEAEEEYEQGIDVEAEYFLQYYGLGSVSEDVFQEIKDMYKEIYQHARFRVKEVVKTDDDYFVEIIINPIDIIVNSEFAISATVDDFVASADPEYYSDDKVLDDTLARLVIQTIGDNMTELGYLESKSVVIEVVKDEHGFYGFDDNSISLVDQEIIAY